MGYKYWRAIGSYYVVYLGIGTWRVLTVHLVWIAKFGCHVVKGEIQKKYRG
jgi:hypothetical protein